MQFTECIRLAFSAIKANRMRSLLTMLGIIIGISSVITISAIGTSAQGVIEDELKGLGVGYLYIYLDFSVLGDYITDEDSITSEEADALKERFGDELVYYAPYEYFSTKAVSGRLKADISVTGVGAGYDKCTENIIMEKGRFINENDIKRCSEVIVIPVEAAEFYFGSRDAVGKMLQVDINGSQEDFLVVGVYSQKKTALSALNIGTSYSCYTGYSVTAGNDYRAFYLECFVDSDDIEETGRELCGYLSKLKRRSENIYKFDSAQGQSDIITKVLNVLSLALGAIAAISLIVGGIGIMNIMLVSVTERTREIGIRKALGAKVRDILRQFLIESVILSVVGGIIGILLGVGTAFIAAVLLGARLVISPATVLLSVAFSAAVGIIFGIFPARKAARLDPIEALRYE